MTANYGDQTTTLTDPAQGVGGLIIPLTHDYTTTGTYTLTLSVTNGNGVTSTARATVIIGYGARVPNGPPS